MLRRYQYIRTFLPKFPEERFGKIVITVVLGLSMVVAAFGSNVQSTHKVHAESMQPHRAALENTINEVFGPDGPAAVSIAMCESSMNPSAANQTSIGGSHAAGVFQILYPSTWRTTSQASMSPFDARANVIAAHEIFVRDGRSWREWACQP